VSKASTGGIVNNAPTGGVYVAPTLYTNVSSDHKLTRDEYLTRYKSAHGRCAWLKDCEPVRYSLIIVVQAVV